MNDNTSLQLQSFFPLDQLKVISVTNENDLIIIKLKSQTKSCVCPKCGTLTKKYHGTYTRRVQDLPIHGKQVFYK